MVLPAEPIFYTHKYSKGFWKPCNCEECKNNTHGEVIYLFETRLKVTFDHKTILNQQHLHDVLKTMLKYFFLQPKDHFPDHWGQTLNYLDSHKNEIIERQWSHPNKDNES